MYTFIIISLKIYRKSDNHIVMECSPAYATTEFKTKLVTLLTIRLCLYTHSTAYANMQYSTTNTVICIKYNYYYYYLNLLLIDQLLSQCAIQLIMTIPLPSSSEYEIPTV